MPAIKRRPGLWCSLVFLRPPREDLSLGEMALLSLVFFWVDSGSLLISVQCLFWPEVPLWAREQRPPVCPSWRHMWLGPFLHFAALTLPSWRRSEEGSSTPAPQWGAGIAVAVAVAGVMAVLTIVAGVWTLETGALTPGIDVKIPETGTMTGILRWVLTESLL